MTTNQIKELARQAAEVTLTAYILRPDKPERAGKSFNRGFGNTKVQQLAIDAAFKVLSSAIKADDILNTGPTANASQACDDVLNAATVDAAAEASASDVADATANAASVAA